MLPILLVAVGGALLLDAGDRREASEAMRGAPVPLTREESADGARVLVRLHRLGYGPEFIRLYADDVAQRGDRANPTLANRLEISMIESKENPNFPRAEVKRLMRELRGES